jgi:hypothetical protein
MNRSSPLPTTMGPFLFVADPSSTRTPGTEKELWSRKPLLRLCGFHPMVWFDERVVGRRGHVFLPDKYGR